MLSHSRTGRNPESEKHASNLVLLIPRSMQERDSVVVSCLPDKIDSPCHHISQPDNHQYMARTGPRQPTSAIRAPELWVTPREYSDLQTTTRTKNLSIQRSSIVIINSIRCAHAAVVTRQAILAAMREFVPNPNAARPIEQLQQARRSAVARFVVLSEDPYLLSIQFVCFPASCLFSSNPVLGGCAVDSHRFSALFCDVELAVAFATAGHWMKVASTKSEKETP